MNHISLLFFIFAAAIGLLIMIVYALINKKLTLTIVDSGSVTKIEKVVLIDRGLTIAIGGLSVGAGTFAFVGFSILFSWMPLGNALFILIVGIFFTMLLTRIAAYITTSQQ